MSGDPSHEQFLRLYTRHQHTVFSFLLGAVRSFADAEDLLQDIAVVLWRKFAQYDPARPFVAWALGVAKFEVAKHLRSKQRRTPVLPPDVLEALCSVWTEEEVVLREARERLADCIEKLDTDERRLLSQRYRDGLSHKQLAVKWRRSVGAINTRLVRIRRNLLACTRISPGGASA